MIGRLFRRIRTLSSRGRIDDEIRRELEFHVAMQADYLQTRGLTAADARQAALRDFGGLCVTREAVRDVRGITLWDSFGQDVRFALRTLRRWPGFTIATVLTLALGIGANTAMFSVVNNVLLTPLPYRDAAGLVRLTQSIERPTQNEIGVSISELQDYRQSLHTIDRIVEYHSMTFVLLDHGEPDRVSTGVVSADYFEMFGVRPLYGRAFTAGDEVLDAPAVVLLSHEYWQEKFGGDARVVGHTVQMNDKPHTIVGVLPPIPQYPRENDVYMPTSACPFRAEAERRMQHDRRAFGGLQVFGRLKPGVVLSQASAEVGDVARRIAEQHASVYEPSATNFAGKALALNEELVEHARPILFALLATTGLVLLIACANVANLSLSRIARRDREMAVRLALGAGRARLVRQLVTESSVLALLSGALGVLAAWGSAGLLGRFAARFTPRMIDPQIDAAVLLFALVVSLVTGVVFGIVPAFSVSPSLNGALKDGGASAGEGPRANRMRAGLVIAQVALSFTLLIGAGLFLDSLRRLASVDPGFESDRVLTAEVFGNWSHHRTDADMRYLYRRMLERLEATPGVMAAAVTNAVPLSQFQPGEYPVHLEGVTSGRSTLPLSEENVASEHYFTTLGVPLLKGRLFDALDDETKPPVAVINQTMARLWGERNPLGSRFRRDDGEEWTTVVGVVADVRQYSLDRAASAQYYTPFLQRPGIGARVLLRTDGDPMQYVSPLKAAVYAAHPEVPVERIQTLAELRGSRLAPSGLNAALLAIFAAVALFITLAGIAAVVGTSVSQRTREFGVRMALGASRASVLRMVLRQGLAMTLIGVAVGTASALLLARALTAYLYETQPSDPTIYLSVAMVFCAASLMACLVPARRATAIDPLFALKAE